MWKIHRKYFGWKIGEKRNEWNKAVITALEWKFQKIVEGKNCEKGKIPKNQGKKSVKKHVKKWERNWGNNWKSEKELEFSH